MTDTKKIVGSIQTSADSAARVALSLMEKISLEEQPVREQKANRAYWLTLFHQCMKAASGGHDLESILKSE